MDDLITWLRVQLDDFEAKVEACEANIGHERAGEPYDDGSGIANQDAFPSYPWGVGDAELAYLAAVHPRVVLADVESKRQIVKACEWVNQDDNRTFSEFMAGRAQEARSILRLLALPFADRPGFREEWKP